MSVSVRSFIDRHYVRFMVVAENIVSLPKEKEFPIVTEIRTIESIIDSLNMIAPSMAAAYNKDARVGDEARTCPMFLCIVERKSYMQTFMVSIVPEVLELLDSGRVSCRWHQDGWPTLSKHRGANKIILSVCLDTNQRFTCKIKDLGEDAILLPSMQQKVVRIGIG